MNLIGTGETIVSVVTLLFGMAALIVHVRKRRLWRELRRRGVHVVGEVVQASKVEAGANSAFTVAYLDQNHVQHLKVGAGSFSVGGRIDVFYDPEDPSRAVMRTGILDWLWLGLGIIGCLIGVPGVGAAIVQAVLAP